MSDGHSGYSYSDGTPIAVERGDDGLTPSYDADDVLVLYPSSAFLDKSPQSGKQRHLPIYLPMESSDQTAPLALARQHNGSSKTNTLARGAVVEFILFGKSHRYYASDYPLYAPHYRDKLFVEARILARSIQGDQAIAIEFLEADGSLGAWLSHGIRNAKDWWKKTRGQYGAPPAPKDYDPLLTRTYSTWQFLRNASVDDYPAIHSTGIEFIRIRQEQDKLSRRVTARVAGLIEAAETGQHGCEFVEESAFKILDIYAQIRAGNSPAQLAAYRVGLMAIRAGARATGEWVADSSNRRILKTTFGVIRTDFPPIAKDLFLSSTRKSFSKENLDRKDEFAMQLLGIVVDVTFIIFDVAIFEANAPQGMGKKLGERLAQDLPPSIARAVFAVLKAGLADNPYKSTGSWSAVDYSQAAQKKLYERLEVVICALIGSAIREYQQAKETAEKEKRPLTDVLLSDLGWILVRVATDIGKAFVMKSVDAKLTQWMKARHESETASGRKPISYEGTGLKEIEDRLRSLIVAFHIQVAPLQKPLPPAPGATIVQEKPLPNVGRGPTPEGDVGMNKFASAPVMQPATKPPAPGKKASQLRAPTRRKVKPAQNLVSPAARPSARDRREGTYRDGSGDLVIVSKMKKPASRKDFEHELFRGIEVGLPGWQRAHSQGAGTGKESREGIRYAPEAVNQEFQNQGIERYLRELYSLKPKDTDLFLTTVTTTVPGTLRLKEIQYQVEAVRGNESRRVFEASIEIEDKRESPKVSINVEALVLPTIQSPGGKKR